MCPNGGTALSATAKFCHACAHPAASGTGAPSRCPEPYTPKHLAERILTSKAALEGERKLVTVLFADLKGSMELLADRDPEEARKLLDPVLERMMEAVHRYEGTVNQVMGDGIMALFGAPVAHEDHAIRACYAALRMQEAVKRYAEEVHRTVGVPLHIRIGVNSGEVVVRAIGSGLHIDYTAVGQTTHLAARLEQMAMPGSILIAPTTLNLAEGYVVATPLGERPIKGLDALIEVFEVTGAATVRSRLQARGLTRFVGRDPELEQLRQALGAAGAGHGQVVAVVGHLGVGKSRLFWEFTHSHRTQGCGHPQVLRVPGSGSRVRLRRPRMGARAGRASGRRANPNCEAVSRNPGVRRSLQEGVPRRRFLLSRRGRLRRLRGPRRGHQARRSLDRDKLREAILTIDRNTVFGRFKVDLNGVQIGHKMLTIQWQDGTKVIVWPETLAPDKPRFPTPPWSQRQ